MDIDDCHYEEVYNNLFKNATGLSFDDLYSICKLFDEKTDLSRCLHRAGQQGNVRKLPSGAYKLSVEKYKEMSNGEEPPKDNEVRLETGQAAKITEEIRDLLKKDPKVKADMEKTEAELAKPVPKVHRIKPITHIPKSEPVQTDERPYGNLRRGIAQGGGALALYLVRNMENPFLTTPEMAEFTGGKRQVIGTAMNRLEEQGYVIKDESDGARRAKFKWSGKFRYPFDQRRKSDDELVRYTLKEWTNRNGSKKTIEIHPSEIPVTDVGARNRSVDMVVHPNNHNDVPHSPPSLGLLYPGLGAGGYSDGNAKELIDLHVKATEANLALLKHIQKCIVVEET